jgi:hypothetical protein
MFCSAMFFHALRISCPSAACRAASVLGRPFHAAWQDRPRGPIPETARGPSCGGPLRAPLHPIPVLRCAWQGCGFGCALAFPGIPAPCVAGPAKGAAHGNRQRSMEMITYKALQTYRHGELVKTGEWGLQIKGQEVADGEIEEGDIVEVIKKSGEIKREMVGRIIHKNGDYMICTIHREGMNQPNYSEIGYREGKIDFNDEQAVNRTKMHRPEYSYFLAPEDREYYYDPDSNYNRQDHDGF